jgi:phage gpG-like protein
MIALSFSVEINGIRRKMTLLSETAERLDRPLARVGGMLRKRMQQRFAAGGPGWEPLAASTEKRKMDAQEVGLLATNKGGGSVVKTVGAQARKLASAIASADRAKTVSQVEKAQRRIAVHEQSLETIRKAFGSGKRKFANEDALVAYAQRELRRAKLHGVALRASRGAKDEASRRRVSRIGQRRYKAEDSATRILGSLDRTIALVISRQSVQVGSTAYIGAIHNVGGTAGHGAKIPARPFAYIDGSDMDVVADIFREHMIEALVE